MTADIPAVGLLGGSFDPVHNGHLAIARSFLESPYISELWVLLTPESPHKTDQQLTDYTLRLKMLSLAFQEMEKVTVSDFEQKLPAPYYTSRTVRQLSQTYPQRTFYLCIGGDSFADFTTWHEWEQILSYCDLLVAQRPSSPAMPPDSALEAHTHFVDHTPQAVSSSDIRAKVRNDDDIAGYVPREVADFIYNHQLYQT